MAIGTRATHWLYGVFMLLPFALLPLWRANCRAASRGSLDRAWTGDVAGRAFCARTARPRLQRHPRAHRPGAADVCGVALRRAYSLAVRTLCCQNCCQPCCHAGPSRRHSTCPASGIRRRWYSASKCPIPSRHARARRHAHNHAALAAGTARRLHAGVACRLRRRVALVARMIVERKRWMTNDEFNETFALSQILPVPTPSISRWCSARASAARPAPRSHCSV